MIDPGDFLRVVIDPGCRFLTNVVGKDMGTSPAKVLLLAICMQESGLEHRRQIDSQGNPMDTLARGWPQFEKAGGVYGVMTHDASADYAKAVCAKLAIPFTDGDIHEAFAWNDYLAITFARLLLWTDSQALPAVGDEEAAWDYYIRNWRPGKPHRDRWSKVYPVAVQAVATAVATPVQPFIVPKPGTLTTKTEGGVTQVDLPEMNRSWRTGDFWLSAASGLFGMLLTLLMILGPIIEPAMDHPSVEQWLAVIPFGLGPVVKIASRDWYKAQRVKYAAEVAAAASAKSGGV